MRESWSNPPDNWKRLQPSAWTDAYGPAPSCEPVDNGRAGGKRTTWRESFERRVDGLTVRRRASRLRHTDGI